MNTIIKLIEEKLSDGSIVYNIVLVNGANRVRLDVISEKQANLLFENISKYSVNVVEVS